MTQDVASLTKRVRRFFLYRLGYWYFVFLVLFLLLLLGVVLVMLTQGKVRSGLITIIIMLFILGRGFYHAVRTKVEEPDGLEITPSDAPKLFELIESVRAKLSSPAIDRVKINASFNAHIAEIPRWGSLGGYERYLVLGIPLFLVLSPEEFKAVLGHELAHLSNAHGRSSFRIWRVANIWERIAEEFRKSGRERNLFVWPFLVRYIPALNDESYAHRRENEFIADRSAAEVAGAKAAASALLKIALYSHYLDDVFWHGVYRQTQNLAHPPNRVFFDMEALCNRPLSVDEPEDLLNRLTTVRTRPSFTHPSLAERLDNLGVQPHWPSDAGKSALQALLDERADDVLSKAGQWWAESATPMWVQMTEAFTEARDNLRSLEEKAASGIELSDDESIEKALLIEQVFGVEQALEAFKNLRSRRPEDVVILFHTGRLFIQSGDPEGEEILGAVVEKDPQAIPECCSILFRHHRSRENTEQAYAYYRYAVDFMVTNEKVQEERTSLPLGDEYLPPDLTVNEIEDIRRQLDEKGYVKRAYIIRQQFELSDDFPQYLVLVKLKGTLIPKRHKKLVDELAQCGLMAWDYYVVPIKGRNRELEYKASVLSGSRVL